MDFGETDEIAITDGLLSAWQEELFDGQTLRIPVEALRYWPLHEYLWPAVYQAIDLAQCQTESELAWQTPAWDFGRFAKAHPSLHDLDDNHGAGRDQESPRKRFLD